MKQQEIEIILTEILIDKLAISKTEISSESTMKELGADTLDEIEIIIELEQKLGIAIPDEIMPGLQNIGTLCNSIEKEFEL
ncbi:MAG: acyl carrier protein [Prolixibacteraceae bacterium]|jgi:acyl carrier protein|nr:acyl carrier protein [Prolixibacteraceae bacterium]MBT6765048.1 acyl carrier protein [Prolixibacteraceae bacterium]MBT7000165.1 acyl carrier protein [Prolixibacteraceae bacterium]MBT7395655.1 acyl carrier protein [Prolixibacteraceae bacterium]